MLVFDHDLAAFAEAEPRPVDVGPIIYASVDPGLCVIIGEHGTTRFPTPIVTRDEWPDIVPAEDVNRAPGDDARPVAIGEAMAGLDGTVIASAVERLTFASIKALMKRELWGEEGALSGSGAGRRRTKPPKREPIREMVEDERPGNASERFEVRGLTAGEQNFYDIREGEAGRVLREYVGAIVRGDLEEPVVRPQSGPMRHNFSLYGMDELELRILRKFRGHARRALIQHAHMVDGPRVKAIDGIASAPVGKNAFGTIVSA